MKKEIEKVLDQIKETTGSVIKWLRERPEGDEDIAREMNALVRVIEGVGKVVPSYIHKQYRECFEKLQNLCRKCENIEYFCRVRADLLSSIELFEECIEEIKTNYISRMRACPCCGNEVVYEESVCPLCQAGEGERLMISFFKKEHLAEGKEGTKILQMGSDKAIPFWLGMYCPHMICQTIDFEGIVGSCRADIMNSIPETTYDIILYTCARGFMRDEELILSEMKRILKPNGKMILFAPSEKSIADLANNGNGREEDFFVYRLGLDYFGQDVFEQCMLEDVCMLYVLTKSGQESLQLAEEIVIDEQLCCSGPLVSIILPCYNHEQYVAEVIESIINQSYKNIEILVGDDGSTDHTVSIVKQYSSYFKKEFYFEENTNSGLWELLGKEAQGKYIAVAHSDDVWEKDKIALQVAYMEKHSGCGACFTWAKYRDDDEKELSDLIFIQPNRDSDEWMRYFWQNGNALCHPSILIRREIRQKIKRTAGRQLPDFFSWVQLVQMSSIHIIPKVLVWMRRNEKCMSFPSKENSIRSIIENSCGWLAILRDMKEDFFKKAFYPFMIHPQAETKEAIKCEKYFLMLRVGDIWSKYNAACYYFEIFNDVKECMETEYYYTISDFAQDELKILQS